MVALDEGASVFLRAWARRASVFLLGLDNRGGVNGSGWASFRVVQPVAVARPRKKQRGPYAAAPYGDAECFCNRRGLGSLRFCDRPLKPCHRIHPSWGDNCARNLLRHSVRILRLPLPLLGRGRARRWGGAGACRGPAYPARASIDRRAWPFFSVA